MEWKKEEEVGGEEEEKKKEAKVCEYFLSNFLSNLSYNEENLFSDQWIFEDCDFLLV